MAQATITQLHACTYEPIVASLDRLLIELPLRDCPGLLGELERLKGIAWGKIIAGEGGNQTTRANDLLTMAQVAKRLNVPETRAYELARQGKLPAVKIGKYVRMTAKALAEYQASLPKA